MVILDFDESGKFLISVLKNPYSLKDLPPNFLAGFQKNSILPIFDGFEVVGKPQDGDGGSHGTLCIHHSIQIFFLNHRSFTEKCSCRGFYDFVETTTKL